MMKLERLCSLCSHCILTSQHLGHRRAQRHFFIKIINVENLNKVWFGARLICAEQSGARIIK